ncbi:MAG: tetratricopeptide repeat protein [Planctomycetota bacterium]|nr:tetratricopeptide repeat protein [Planctomycetota bacterium]
MATIKIQQAVELAFSVHQAGRLPEADAMYRQILAQEPNHPDVWHLRGVVAGQAGRPDLAVEMIRRAIALEPRVADYHSNLGQFLHQQGKLDDAMTAWKQAIVLNAKHAQAHSNLGVAFREKRQLELAIDYCRKATQFKEEFFEAYNNLGNALRDNGQLNDAIESYRQAIRLRPNYAEAFNNLSVALRESGQLPEALAASQEAIKLNPTYAEARDNLGNALRDSARAHEAIAAHQEALKLKPEYAEAFNNLGLALKDAGQLDEAVASLRHAIALKPGYAEAHNNLGNVLKDQAKLDEAIACYANASKLAPHSSLFHSNQLYTRLFHHDADAQSILKEHRAWDHLRAQPLKDPIGHHANSRSINRPLRIGYVSPDFRDHVVGRNVLPLIREHDRKAFEIYCYADVSRPDHITAKFRDLADQWLPLQGISDEDLARRIRKDRIDILVDLTLHLANNRLLTFARKPAPVQVTFAGYPGTTGLSTIDYRLTDPYLDPGLQNDADYTEQSIRLPNSFWCYEPDERSPQVNPLPALSAGHITFGCLNNFCKINDGVLELWARVLTAVPNSKLLLLAWPGTHRQWVIDVMQARNISPSRIEFAELRVHDQYLALYHRIDIGLDTFPYNGHTTSLDSYWMGVPVVTLVGNTVVGRAGLSQLSNLGLTEWVAPAQEEYVRIATELAGDASRLSSIRGTLRQKMQSSPLMSSKQFTRNIEAAYQQMWIQWCRTPQ